MKFIKYILPAIFISGSAFSADLCTQLYNTLNSENYSQSINQTVYFYYSVFDRRNFIMGVEYKYNVNSSNNESSNNHYTELSDDDLTGDTFNFNSSSSNASGSLTDCNSYENSATFSIKMVHPGLKIFSEPRQPTFNIYFSKSSYGWQVSSVSSSNFINLYHTHLVNSYKNYAKSSNGSFSDDFYTISLKNMVENEVYPALKEKLGSEFNLKILNFN